MHFLKHIFILGFLSFCVIAKGQTFSFESADNKALPQPFCYDIVKQPNGFYYIATGLGLAKSDGRKITKIPADSESPIFISKLLATETNVLAGTNNGELYTLKKDTLKLTHSFDTGIEDMLETNGELWILTSKGVHVNSNDIWKDFEAGNKNFKHFKLFNENLYISSASGIYTFKNEELTLTNSSNVFSFFEYDNSLFAINSQQILKLKNNEWVEHIKTPFFLQNPQVKIESNYAWIFDRSGLYISDLTFSSWMKFEQNSGLPQTGIGNILLDDNYIIIGTLGYGLYQLNLNEFFVHLSDINDVNEIATIKEHQYFVSAKEGVYWVNTENPFNITTDLIYNKETIDGIYFDGTYLFGGTTTGKIYKWEFKKESLKRIKSQKLPSSEAITGISPTHENGNIWVNQNLEGTLKLSENLKTISQWNTTNGLLHNNILKTLTDEYNRTWFVSKSSGLPYLNKTNFNYIDALSGVSSLDFTDICESNKQVVLSSDGGGLLFVNYKNELSELKEIHGLGSDFLMGVTSNTNNELYTNSSKGIFKITSDEIKTYKSFPLDVIFKERSIVVNGNDLLLSSDKGLLIKRENNTSSSTTPVCKLLELVSDISGNIKEEQGLKFGDHRIQFQATYIHPDFAGKEVLEFKLDGFDKQWQDLTNNIKVYQSVRTGEYKLNIRIKGRPETLITRTFSIKIPFWKRKDFLVVLIIGIVLLGFLIVKIRTRQLQQSNIELEKKVQSRTKALEQKNKELEQFTYALSHDLKAPAMNLNELVNIYNQMNQELADDSKMVWQQIEKSSGKILENLLGFLDILKVASQGKVPTEKIDIAYQIKQVQDTLATQISKSNTNIQLNLSASTEIIYNPIQLQSILYNLVSNAIKYKQDDVAPEIKISSFIKDGYTGISVKDNGLGINLETDGEKLFAMFRRIHSHTEGTGVGLALVNSIVEKNGGKIEVDSEIGKGTTFHLFLAKNNSV